MVLLSLHNFVMMSFVIYEVNEKYFFVLLNKDFLYETDRMITRKQKAELSSTGNYKFNKQLKNVYASDVAPVC